MTTKPPDSLMLTATFPGAEVMAIEPTTLNRAWPPASLPRALARLASAPSADMYEEEDDDEEDDGNLYLGNGVAVVCIDGPLMQRGGWFWDGYAAILGRVECALTKPGTRVLVLKINSPGGVAAGCFEAARKVADMAAAAAVPVLVYADEMAASAAYALACCAAPGGIWLPESGCVGSVGVVATYLDATAALKAEGLRYVVVASGAYKADGHPAKAIDAATLERLRQPVDHLAGLFFAWVSERRRMTTAAVSALEAGVLWGRNALAAGLADRIGSVDDCLAYASALAASPSPLASLRASPVRAEVPEEQPMSEAVSPAPEATVNDAAPDAPVAIAPAVLLESVPSVSLADHDAAIGALNAELATTRAALSVIGAERDALSAKVTALTADLDAANTRVKAAETARITAKVDALVGVKITAAERDDELELAIADETKFDRRMGKRQTLNLTGERIVAETGNEHRVSDSADAGVDRLNKLTDEHIKAHPGTPRHEAMVAVMRQHPSLCAAVPA